MSPFVISLIFFVGTTNIHVGAQIAVFTEFPDCNLEFIQVPTSVNTTNGSTAIFTCIGICTGQAWLVNGKQTSHMDNLHRGIVTEGPLSAPGTPEGSMRYVMKVPAEKVNNNTEICCTIYKGLSVNTSEVSYLRIQGLLGPVQNLTAMQANNTAIKLQFIAPPSLAGVPIIYTVHISSDNGMTDRAMNISMEEFFFVPDDHCPIYIFSVVSVNGAGQGGMSSVSAVLLGAPVMAESVDHTVWFSSLSSVSVNITFSVISECVQKYPVNLTIELVSTDTNHSRRLGPCPLTEFESNQLSTEWCPSVTNVTSNHWSVSASFTESVLQLHTRYMLQIIASNAFGNSTSASIISTAFVEHASAQLTLSGLLCVQCVFASGVFHSWGCQVQVRESSTRDVVKSFLVPKTVGIISQNCESGLPPTGLYTVVFDTNDKGVMLGKQPAYIVDTVFTFPAPPITKTSAVRTMQDTRGLYTTMAVPTARLERDLSVGTFLTGVGTTCLLMALVVSTAIILAVCLIHKKKKADYLKIVEMHSSMKQLQVESEDKCDATSPASVVSTVPLYDNPLELLPPSTVNPQAVKMQKCIAYGHLPFKSS